MRRAALVFAVLGLAACTPERKPSTAQAAADAVALSPGAIYTADRSAAATIMIRHFPDLAGAAPRAFTDHSQGLEQCTSYGARRLALRLCGPGQTLRQLLVTSRQAGADIGPAVLAISAVIAPAASPDDLRGADAEARAIVSRGETGTVCLTRPCFTVAGLGKTWIMQADARRDAATTP